MSVAAIFALTVLLVSACGSASHTGQGAAPNAASVAAENKAWDELSSGIEDLEMQDLTTKDALDFQRRIGVANGSAVVQWDKYQAIARRLHRWQRRRAAIGDPYWHDIARAGIDISEAMVRYATSGRDVDLMEGDRARDELQRILQEHCAKGQLEIVLNCS